MEKPGEDATAKEIAEWLEYDFMDSVSEGIDDALDDMAEEEDTESGATDDTDEE